MFESSVNSYDSQTLRHFSIARHQFESSVNSYDSQTHAIYCQTHDSLRVV